VKIAFILFKYFPFGGLQRDFFRIASACARRGHDVEVYTLSWQGEKPEHFNLHLVPVRAVTNHGRYRRFAQWLRNHFQDHPVDVKVGFNKLPGLDIYYAADACYEEKARTLRGGLYRLGNRYKYFHASEHAVFSPESTTEILLISTEQKPVHQRYYQTPDERFHLLPPGISPDRRAPDNARQRRQAFRDRSQLRDNHLLMLMVGSGFKTKGLDRALLAMKSLPEHLLSRTSFVVIGQDNPSYFYRYARSLGIARRMSILEGRDDIPDFLLGADLLLHPAYHENTGTVLLEAAVAGLPVLTTDVCGYAHYIEEAGAGIVLQSPFSQPKLNDSLAAMLDSDVKRQQWQENGLRFAATADIYSMPEKAAVLIEKIAERKNNIVRN
jgi:UDP-glucose:(heptosyl)LPS alpha-1,3-glucosyltransferase